MSEASGPASLPVPALPELGDSAATQTGLRDLMGLMALPALWVGRDAEEVLKLMTEAVERLVTLDACYIEVPKHPGQTPISILRVAGRHARTSETETWQATIDEFRKMPIISAAASHLTPAGRMSVVRLSMGYSSIGGSIWFGSSEPTFPTLTQSALLRTAATLAATGLQTARIDHERERASRAKDEFLAMLGHELRNPLAPIFGALALIKRAGSQELSKPHAIIERQAKHLSRLVDDLLDVSRISQGKVELHKELVNLRLILSAALESVSPLVEQRGHWVMATLPPLSTRVFGDPTRLTQIFSNLLTNAAKYTQPGGKVWLETLVDAQTVVVTVRDNGPGITPELMPRLFHIFEQGLNTIDRSGGGLGIGLSLVENFVRLHGGTVSATSAGAGQGSEFIVRLPLVTADVAAPVQDTAGQRVEPRAFMQPVRVMRVMLVDDNVDAVETAAEILRGSGLEVATAFDAVQGLALFASFDPMVAVIDIGLPGMNGYELAAELQRRMGPRRCRLIALSGYGQTSDHEKSRAAGFERHLVKPVGFDELVAVVSTVDPPA